MHLNYTKVLTNNLWQLDKKEWLTLEQTTFWTALFQIITFLGENVFKKKTH